MQVVVQDLMTSYAQTGQGPALLYLHGWGDSHETFKALAKELGTKYTAVLLDLPGFGKTEAPKSDWSVDDYVNFVADFLKKIDIKLYAVIGHSNGGTIAIRGLANADFTAEKLVLLASAGVRDVYKGRKKALRYAAKAAKVATYPLPKKLQNRIKKKAYRTIGSDMFVAEHLQETFKRVVTYDVQADARTLKIPTLLIYGSADTATPPNYGQLFHDAIAGSQLEILEGAEHFVHHDRPDEVYKLIKEFL